jgi:nucleotide-binding universal stress UspA family protein
LSVSRASSILVAYDGSAASRRGLEATAELVGYGSTVVVAASSDDAGSADALLEARQYLNDRHVLARYVAAEGRPLEGVLSAAAEIGADLLVVARANGMAESLTRRSPCNVLLVR